MRKAAELALLLILLASISGCAGNVPADSAPQQTEPTAVHEEPGDEAESSATSAESSDTPVISLEPNREQTMENKRNSWSNRTGDFLLSSDREDFLVQQSQSAGPENGASQGIQRLCWIFGRSTN